MPTRSKTKPRIKAKKPNPIPKRVRSMMVSKEQDAKNKARGPQSKGKASKSGVERSIKSATDKAKSAVRSGASVARKLVKGGGAVGLALASSKLGNGKDTMSGMESRRNEFVDKRTKQEADAKRAKAATKANKTLAEKAKREKADETTNQKKRAVQRAALANKPATKTTAKPATKPKASTSSEPRTIAEAKRLGKSYFIGSDGKRKAAVTAADLQKSGHKTLGAYLNAKGKPAKTSAKPKGASNTDNAYKPKATPSNSDSAYKTSRTPMTKEKPKTKVKVDPKTGKKTTYYLKSNGSYGNYNKPKGAK